jgi:hypothetical protein
MPPPGSQDARLPDTFKSTPHHVTFHIRLADSSSHFRFVHSPGTSPSYERFRPYIGLLWLRVHLTTQISDSSSTAQHVRRTPKKALNQGHVPNHLDLSAHHTSHPSHAFHTLRAARSQIHRSAANGTQAKAPSDSQQQQVIGSFCRRRRGARG